jgi:hypothetical protein
VLAYRVNNHNAIFIRTRNNGVVPKRTDKTQYIVFPGNDSESILVDEPEFYRRFTITTRLSRSQGRYVVQEAS